MFNRDKLEYSIFDACGDECNMLQKAYSIEDLI